MNHVGHGQNIGIKDAQGGWVGLNHARRSITYRCFQGREIKVAVLCLIDRDHIESRHFGCNGIGAMGGVRYDQIGFVVIASVFVIGGNYQALGKLGQGS